MSTGDLRFYRSSGSLIDQAIAVTGPFVHVDIELADGTAIGELGVGLRRYPAPPPMPKSIAIYPTAQHVSAEALAEALNWAIEQLGATPGAAPPAYGWADIVDAAAQHVDPAFPFVGAAGQWDCSDFVTRVLLRAQLPLPDALAQEPHTVTPSALAAALGVR